MLSGVLREAQKKALVKWLEFKKEHLGQKCLQQAWIVVQSSFTKSIISHTQVS